MLWCVLLLDAFACGSKLFKYTLSLLLAHHLGNIDVFEMCIELNYMPVSWLGSWSSESANLAPPVLAFPAFANLITLAGGWRKSRDKLPGDEWLRLQYCGITVGNRMALKRSRHCTVAKAVYLISCVRFVLLRTHDQFVLFVHPVRCTSSYLVFILFLLRFSCHWACRVQVQAMSTLFLLHFPDSILNPGL